MADIPVTITLDRSGLPGGLDPLVISGTFDGNALGLLSYQPPALVPRYGYAPDPADVDGSELISVAWEQTAIGFDWCREGSTETELQAAYAEVAAAIGQFSFPVTTQVSDAPAQVWTADRGTMNPSTREYSDLVDPGTVVYAVAIPVHPIAGSA